MCVCVFVFKVEVCLDWLRVFVAVCMQLSSDFSSIACAWSLMKSEGLAEFVKSLDKER